MGNSEGSDSAPRPSTANTQHLEEGTHMSNRLDYTPVALYARVSSDRQDVDLSVAAQLRALRDHARKNDYVVVREYVDEAESGRIADRPGVQQDDRRRQQGGGPIQGNPCLEILSLH